MVCEREDCATGSGDSPPLAQEGLDAFVDLLN